RRNNRIANFDYASLNNFSNQTASIEKHVLEALCFAGKFAGTNARIAVFDPAKARRTNLKLSADKPHELNSFSEEIAAAVFEFKAASFKENGIHKGNLAIALLTPIKTPFSGRVAIAFEALAGNGLDF